MKAYFCWITLLIPQHQDNIVAGLVRRGYMIGAAATNGEVLCSNSYDAPAVLLVFSLYKVSEPEGFDCNTVHQDVVSICKEINALHYSVVVSLATSDTTWSAANFNAASDIEPILTPALPSSNKKLN